MAASGRDFAMASTGQLKIIHVKQMHARPFEGATPADFFEDVVRSQFRVISAIKQYPGIPVVTESLDENRSRDSVIWMSSAARCIFPNGIPADFDQLTHHQKEFLYEYEAGHTLFFLGEIKTLYKSIGKETKKELDEKIKSGKYTLMISPREEEAMRCSKKAAIKHFGKLDGASVLLIFGAFHDFKPYCEREGFEHESIETTTSPFTWGEKSLSQIIKAEESELSALNNQSGTRIGFADIKPNCEREGFEHESIETTTSLFTWGGKRLSLDEIKEIIKAEESELSALNNQSGIRIGFADIKPMDIKPDFGSDGNHIPQASTKQPMRYSEAFSLFEDIRKNAFNTLAPSSSVDSKSEKKSRIRRV